MHRSQLGCLLPRPVAIGLKAPRRRHTHTYIYTYMDIYMFVFTGAPIDKDMCVCGGGADKLTRCSWHVATGSPLHESAEKVYIYTYSFEMYAAKTLLGAGKFANKTWKHFSKS